LQRIEGAKAEDAKALLDKQLKLIGVQRVCADPELEGHHEKSHITRLYLYCSDGGPDQLKYRKMMRTLMDEGKYEKSFFIDNCCLMHAPHLAVRTGLRVADAWCQRQLGCLTLTAGGWLLTASLLRALELLPASDSSIPILFCCVDDCIDCLDKYVHLIGSGLGRILT
jgi:hypothetical protein